LDVRYSFSTNPNDLASNYDSASSDSSATLTLDDNGQTIYGRLIDSDGVSFDTSVNLDVYDIAPTATMNVSVPDDGDSGQVTVSLNNASDASSTDMNWGLRYGFATTYGDLPASWSYASTSSSTVLTLSGDGPWSIWMRVYDKDNGYTDYNST